MTLAEAERLLADLNEDERHDLLMALAEQFDYKVVKDGEDITYFLSTGE